MNHDGYAKRMRTQVLHYMGKLLDSALNFLI